MNKNRDRQGAFNSVEFRKAKNNRLIRQSSSGPFHILFSGPFSVQSIFSDIGSLQIPGETNLEFFFAMSLFLTNYIKSHVYPDEDMVVKILSRKGQIMHNHEKRPFLSPVPVGNFPGRPGTRKQPLTSSRSREITFRSFQPYKTWACLRTGNKSLPCQQSHLLILAPDRYRNRNAGHLSRQIIWTL